MNSDLPSKLYTIDEVREFDRFAIEETGIAGITLMRRAASACLDCILTSWPHAQSFAVFCGGGNNAGDGYIVAALLADKGLKVQVHVLGKEASLSADAQRARKYCVASSASIFEFDKGSNEFEETDVIVDALIGIGVIGELRPEYVAAIEQINKSSAKVLAVDIPSGINADTGNNMGVAVKADITVTFIGLKRGLFTSEGPQYSGEIVFSSLDVQLASDLDVDAEAVIGIERLSYRALIKRLKPRHKHAHKNDFGHILVVGGDSGMGGAIAMSAEAALRAGAGLVSVATHQSHASAILSRCPELMVSGIDLAESLELMLDRASVIVLGPGLGQSAWSRMIFETCLKHIQAKESDKHFVIDADGLNLLAEKNIKNRHWVLTPHPGEAARLSDKLRSDRFSNVNQLQKQYGGTVLLKGAGTLIKDEESLSLVPYGNPGMSTAGMGDVLSGVIAALLAQSCEPKFAATLGAVVHALAADRCAAEEGERGLRATDLMGQIRRLLNDR